jgi:DNA-binding transcriptional ArsR family regulator
VPTDLDHTLKALADPARRALVEQLRRRPQRPSDLAAALALSRPAVSRHLRVLRQAGLIDQDVDEADGRVRPIQLVAAPLQDLRDWADELQAFWQDQLAAFKAHVERSPAAAAAQPMPAAPSTVRRGRAARR